MSRRRTSRTLVGTCASLSQTQDSHQLGTAQRLARTNRPACISWYALQLLRTALSPHSPPSPLAKPSTYRIPIPIPDPNLDPGPQEGGSIRLRRLVAIDPVNGKALEVSITGGWHAQLHAHYRQAALAARMHATCMHATCMHAACMHTTCMHATCMHTACMLIAYIHCHQANTFEVRRHEATKALAEAERGMSYDTLHAQIVKARARGVEQVCASCVS